MLYVRMWAHIYSNAFVCVWICFYMLALNAFLLLRMQFYKWMHPIMNVNQQKCSQTKTKKKNTYILYTHTYLYIKKVYK